MLYDYEPEWRPSATVVLDRADVLAFKRPGWPVGYSRVAYAKWSADEADARIDEVLAFFDEVAFNWHVGPSSAPHDLVDRLTARGLVVLARRGFADHGALPRLASPAAPRFSMRAVP